LAHCRQRGYTGRHERSDPNSHGRLRPAQHRLFQRAAIYRRPARRRMRAGFSKALKFIGARLAAAFGTRVAIDYVFNIMDHGHKAEDILTLVENGEMTLGYQSSSYLTDRVPQLGVLDLPFLFSSNAQARGAMDGALGEFMVRKTEERVNYRI